ncbi:hypothetical protein A4X09_0g4631 [Tilletia walkeri]|uniref:Uncharacterized protein n=1 Tax=Tilletia walkeri TaxID=117179 RepID=A0A8X7N910_9BASI|nr:hypothetical protein A4X09_0g4631 [Tilletia walkeri]
MLGSPERRLFIVRTVRLCTIFSCILFFGGVVTQLKSDTHQATRPTCDDQPSVPLPKRYLPTLIVSRIFLLFLILVVFLAHFPLSDRARSALSKLSFPLQGSAWAQTDMTVGDQGKRSEQLDADLQGDVSKLIGSAIILLFASAQELSRRITQYLLVAAFLIASVGLLNLIAAILLYNPAYSGPFAVSKSTSFLQHDDNSTSKSVLRERPSAPSYLHALSTSTASAMKSFGKVGLAPKPDTALHPARLHAGTHPASRTIERVPVPTAMEEAHLRPTPPQTPPPIIQITSPSPSGSHLNPLSPQLAHSSNGRHPLATDEALRLELHQPLAATVGVAVAGDDAKTTPVNNQRIRGESDKDALIRMWTARIAEQRRNDFESSAAGTNIPLHAPTPALPPNTGAGGGNIPATQEPRMGGRMEITAPYLSLREARALYAQRKAAAAVATAGAAAAVSGPTTTSHVPVPTISRQAGDQHSTILNGKPAAFTKTEQQGNEDRGSDADDDAKMGNVSGLYVSRLHSAPKFQSMQGVLALRRSSVPFLSHTEQIDDEAHHTKEPESARRFSSSSRKRSSSSVSISISVSSSGDDRRAVAPRKGRRPPSLTFESCSRLDSSTAPPSTCPSSPEGPPRSETTRWSRTSAGYTVRTGITGTGTVASGFKHAASRLRGGERSDDLPERESKYLSAVLAAIRGPSPTTEQDHHLRPPSFVPPPMPPIPLSPVDSSSRTHPPVSPLRSPGMVSELQSAQKAALARAKEHNKLRSLWLTRPVTTTSPR